MKLISCDLHDYFEIVCMRNSQVEINCNNGDKLTDIAVNIVKKSAQEALQIRLPDETLSIFLTDIAQLAAVNNFVASHNFKVKL